MRAEATRSVALAAALVWLTAAGADANEPTALVEEAVAAYTQALNTEERDLRLEEFRRAERLFARAATAGVRNADLYTNLGNAALQAEHLGRAVLAFRRALLVDPAQPRALQNLVHARSLLPEWVPRPEAGGLLDTFFFWHRTIPRAQRATAAAACFAAAGVLLAAALRFRQAALRNAALLPALAWSVLLGSVWMDPVGEARTEVVVTADETVARAADSALAPSAFPQPLPDGVEVRIVERRLPWLRVRLANGRDAWVSESSVTSVALPGG
jgi:tetratricopeptide (TPR) repeat protein